MIQDSKGEFFSYKPQVIIVANTVLLVDQIYQVLQNIIPTDLRAKDPDKYEEGKINIERLYN